MHRALGTWSFLLVLVATQFACQDTMRRWKGEKKDKEALGLGVGSGAAAAADLPITREQVLELVDNYLFDNTSTFTRGNTSLYAINTYTVDKSNIFHKLADTYDNALAAIFWSEFGKPHNAMKILNSFIRLMGYRGYEPTNSDRIANFQGLPARFSFKGGSDIMAANEPSDSYVVDTGNNSFLGIAFCKFAKKYKSRLSDAGRPYLNASFDILAFLSNKRACADGSGFEGRGDDGHWVSIEHNLDVYALAQCLASEFAEGTAERQTINRAVSASGSFINRMYDEATGLYRTGSGGCGQPANLEGAIAVDAQTWRYLADAESGDLPLRTERSLKSVLDDKFFIPDTNDLPNGCEVDPIAGVEDLTLCADIPIARLIYGVRFTDRGRGIQLENTGSAYMAMARYFEKNPSKRFSEDRLQLLRGSLVSLLHASEGGGMPASLRTHPIYQVQDGGTTNHIFNTGLSWDYFKDGHTASTIWTGLALAYKPTKSEEADEGFNPYSATSSRVSIPGSEPMQSINLSSVESFTCQPARELAVPEAGEREGCRLASESIDSYCSTLCSAQDSWFEPGLESDSFLASLDVKRENLCSVCGKQMELQACAPGDLLKILQYIWRSYAKGCTGST